MSKAQLQREQSSVGLCEPPSDLLVDKKEVADAVLSVNLVVPMTMVCGMVYLTYIMAQDLEAGLLRQPGENPVKGVWLVGPLFFTAFYLQVVYFGKKFMETQKPLKIKPFVFTYNLYQCLLNLWTVWEMIQEVRSNEHYKLGIWGNFPQKDNVKGFRISLLVWMHYNNKFVELLDTLWMILKKKDQQISFLHCYHHILLIWVWFYCCKVEPGGDSWFGACVNSFIHVIMYAYYTLALLGIPCPWKKWITNCQMIQFAVCLTHAGYVFYAGNMPVGLSFAQAFVMVNMLVLFGLFYIKAYSKKKDDKDKAGDKKAR